MTSGEPPAWITYAAGGAMLVWMYTIPRLIGPRFRAFMKRNTAPEFEWIATRIAGGIIGGALGILGFFVVLIAFYVIVQFL